MRKDKETTSKEIEKYFKDSDLFMFMGLNEVNHSPHPYMIGANHVKYAADNHGGSLGAETCKAVRCAHPRCNTPYEDHTSDLVCFLQLKRNCTQKEGSAALRGMVKHLGEDAFDGLSFVETEEKFRIT